MTRIGSDALPPDPQEQRQELSFPVTIKLDQQKLQLKSGTTLPLQVGMSLTANIKLRKVSYLQLLLGEFQDKASRFNASEPDANPVCSSELPGSIRSYRSETRSTGPASDRGPWHQCH